MGKQRAHRRKKREALERGEPWPPRQAPNLLVFRNRSQVVWTLDRREMVDIYVELGHPAPPERARELMISATVAKSRKPGRA